MSGTILCMKSRMLRMGVVFGLMLLTLPAVSYAQFSSPNYQVDEIFLGSGGELDACSDEYCAQQSVGGTGGSASSDSYGVMAGFFTPDEPTLSVVVTGNIVVDLGILSESSTAAASTQFTVASYLSDGYVVRILGNPPTNVSGNRSHALTALNSPNQSQPGVEQFGINLVANTTPGIGANPVQEPDDSFSYGQPTIPYSQPDYFKYESGDIIAESGQESGQTTYTMSIMANISTSTPGGRYRTVLVVQVVPSF